MRKKLGLFWFAAALLGAALIFVGCETEADEKIVYLPGEMIHLDVVVANVADLAKALADDEVLAIGFDGNTSGNTLTVGLTVGDGKAIYILNGGTLKTDTNFNLTVKGVVYVGIGGILDVSAGKVIVDGGQVSVLPAKSVAAITGAGPGTLKVADALSVNNGKTGTDEATVLGTDKVSISGALEFTAPTVALINAAFTNYVKTGGTVNVAAAVTVADTTTVTVPAGKILNVAAALTLAAGAELVATGDVNVATTGSLILTAAAGTGGAKISGAGGVNAGATTITGIWQAVGTGGTVTIAATGAATSSITGATTVALTAVASGDGVITQNAGTSGNALSIGAATTIDLKGNTSTLLGKIVLIAGSNPGKLSLTAATSKILIGTGSGGAAASGVTTITIGGKSVTSTGLAVDDYQVASAKLVQIGGTTAGSITASTTSDDDVPIASDSAFTGA